ncbi:malonate decarboxylase holo-[acyl-carrier-protein] synthase [Pseudoduganella sp. S-14]|jgi:phosphoribosyl-dephospho-CoA transferase|uniref:malonate decarboxylase holo-[acyl-carrier-protein] synthase n=1 Tax=Pseudoduganella sp. S-14 TaxID=3404065 RepID=UPI003CEC6725
MHARHDLAWLTREGWQDVLATATPGTPAHAALARWAACDWPLVVRRRDDAAQVPASASGHTGAHAGDICLGLAAPPDPVSAAKLRLPLRVPARHIARHSAPMALDAVVQALPARWQAPFARLATASAGLDLRVFGSLALQALTGQAYLRDASDIDLLFRPRDGFELDAGTLLLASFLDELPLDGEIIFPSGQAVAWKEWFTARAHTERVLVKSHASVKLGTRAELRAELEPA